MNDWFSKLTNGEFAGAGMAVLAIGVLLSKSLWALVKKVVGSAPPEDMVAYQIRNDIRRLEENFARMERAMETFMADNKRAHEELFHRVGANEKSIVGMLATITEIQRHKR